MTETPPPAGPPLIGGRYELGELLGRGGMAEVRKGSDSRLGRVVAIKRLRTDLASDATFQARFRREAQSAASLNHPAIVSVYDTGEELARDGSGVSQPYIVMEFVAGRTLRDILREGRKILPGARPRDHLGRARRARLQPPRRDHPPRHQARQRDAHAQRRRQGHGLRHRPRDERRQHDDADGRGRRHRAVPLPRAGARRDRRLALGRLLRRLPALRAAHRPAAVRRRQPGGRGLPARARAGRPAVDPRLRPHAGRRRHRDEGTGQAARGPLPVRRRDAQRHRALPRRPPRPGPGAGPGARARLPGDPADHGRAVRDREHDGASAHPAAAGRGRPPSTTDGTAARPRRARPHAAPGDGLHPVRRHAVPRRRPTRTRCPT